MQHVKGIERLHFFDGQRLDARDLQLEQRYHMGVRRRLNRGLFQPGVVDGLNVTKIDGGHLRVNGGLALDPAGREIVLQADISMSVPGRPPSGLLGGYFLTVRYSEEQETGTWAECRDPGVTAPPARILEEPVFDWTETWPNHEMCGRKDHVKDCAVVIGLVRLDSACQIQSVDPTVRQYARARVPGQAQPVALEGEKDIDKDNPKRLHFQVRGGQPGAVVLYLWGAPFSLALVHRAGQPQPCIDSTAAATISSDSSDLGEHTHHNDGVATDVAARHSHGLQQSSADPGGQASVVVADSYWRQTYANDAGVDYINPDGDHAHNVPASDTGAPQPDAANPHSHTLGGSDQPAGASVGTGAAAGLPWQAHDQMAINGYPGYRQGQGWTTSTSPAGSRPPPVGASWAMAGRTILERAAPAAST